MIPLLSLVWASTRSSHPSIQLNMVVFLAALDAHVGRDHRGLEPLQRIAVPMSRGAMENTIRFWAERWPASPDKTRGNVAMSVNTTLDRFNHGRLNRVFCGKTTIVPELSLGGGIIAMAMPTTTWNEDGVIAQQLFKFMWQRMVLSRNSLAEKHRERFLFIFCDEAQETVNPSDGQFLSLCRQSKCCMTYLTQSLPTYYSKIGGDNPKEDALALVGKFRTHIYHSNACPETNEYASRVHREGGHSARQLE